MASITEELKNISFETNKVIDEIDKVCIPEINDKNNSIISGLDSLNESDQKINSKLKNINITIIIGFVVTIIVIILMNK